MTTDKEMAEYELRDSKRTREALKKLKGKKILDYSGMEWKVTSLITPNQHQTFLLCIRDTECAYQDGVTVVDIVVIDPCNYEVYPATKKNREMLQQVRPDSHTDDKIYNLKADLTAAWMRALGSEDYKGWHK